MKRSILVRGGVALAAALGVVLLSGAAVGAHPLGNFTVNHYSGLTVAPNGMSIDYVLDLAEIPAFQAQADLDAAGSPDAYAAATCDQLATSLDIIVDGSPVTARATSAAISLPPGEGGLNTMRVECAMQAPLALADGSHTLTFTDRNGADRIGWREVTLRGEGVDIRSDLPETTTSGRLTDYPVSDAGSVPRVQTGTATFDVTDRGARLAGLEARASGTERVRSTDPLSNLIGDADNSIWAMTVAIAVAAGLGALHGLAPGHGKTVVAAYLVGTSGTRRQAVGLAAAVAMSHTLGVFILGALTLAASSTFPLERIYAWLQLTSAVIILGLGVWLARSIWSKRRALRTEAHHHHDDHDHDHDHHDHDHHDHEPVIAEARSLVLAGSAPTPAPTPAPPHTHPHDRPHPHPHDHGVFGHRHKVAWDKVDLSQPLGWRSLLALGLSGGILPSASAVIVLLGAVQLGRVGFGAALILAFGAGLSVALVGVGLGVVAVTRRTRRHLDAHALSARLSVLAAPVAAAALLGVGLWLTFRAAQLF